MQKKYDAFAEFYDKLTSNIDYNAAAKYIVNFFDKYGNENGGAVLDLACGTGNLSVALVKSGYDVIGIDISENMLTEASSKALDNILYILGDMTDFKLAEKVDYCVCALDSINHLNSVDDIKKCFSCVFNSLNDGGIFVFDVNTPYKHNAVLGDNSFVFDEEDFFLAWDNENVGDNKIHIFLDFFVFNGKNYDRYSEDFIETAYEINELKSVLENFEILGIYDNLTENLPTDKSQRIFFVCKKVTDNG